MRTRRTTKAGDIRDLVGALEREKAAMAIFLTLESPTSDMETEAVAAGYYHSLGWKRDYLKLQIFTVEQLLDGAVVKMPQQALTTFKQAPSSDELAGTNES